MTIFNFLLRVQIVNLLSSSNRIRRMKSGVSLSDPDGETAMTSHTLHKNMARDIII